MLYGLQTTCGYFDLVTSHNTSTLHMYMYSYSEHKKGGLGRGWMCVVIRGMCVGHSEHKKGWTG